LFDVSRLDGGVHVAHAQASVDRRPRINRAMLQRAGDLAADVFYLNPTGKPWEVWKAHLSGLGYHATQPIALYGID